MKTKIGQAAVGLLLVAGCASIGPTTIDRDRFDYTTAMAESWKTQMLLNIVKLRYGDTPVFLDVPSVISQYAIQGRINLGSGWNAGVTGGDTQALGVEGLYAERPTITYGSASTASDEVAVLTRSIMEIIIEMASRIDVPDEHVAEGRTYATGPEVGSGEGQVLPFSRVHSGREKPEHVFVAIHNRGYWYWIDDRDRFSKIHFSFLMILFSLTETGTAPQAPLITVPVN